MEEGQSQLQALQQGVEEVQVIMQENLVKAEEREEKLRDLDARAEALHRNSVRFQKTSKKLKQKHASRCCKHQKFIGIGVTLAIFIIIIVIIVVTFSGNRESG